MRIFPGLLLLAGLLGAQELPITGLAHAGYKVSDLEKARSFYTGVLGYAEPFDLKDEAGKTTLAWFKINDTQYIEIFPGPGAADNDRFTHVAFATSDIRKLRDMLAARGLAATEIKTGRDGNWNCGLTDPDGHRLEFVEYRPGSLHWKARGKFLDARRISDHLLHVGLTVGSLDAGMAFYRDKLGFREIWRGGPSDNELRYINMRMPGPGGDYVEFMLHDKPPTRQQLGSMHHMCLDVPDIQAAWKTAVERGVPGTDRYKPRVGRNRRWLMNLFDPDGTRTELMEPKTVD